MRSRVTAGLAAVLLPLVLTAPAPAQSDEGDRSKAVEKIYRDYEDGGVIDACDHTRRALKRALEDLAPEADVETPDLRPALEAAIEQHESEDCANRPDPTPTPTPTPSSTPVPTSTPAPTAAPVPDTSDDDLGTVTPLPGSGNDSGGGGGGGGGGDDPLAPEDVAPLDPEITPVPPAATPAPETLPEPSGAPPEPVYVNEDDPLPVALLVPAALLALLALAALAYAVLSRLGLGERRLAGVRRAWSEAAFRVGGTWGDFADWIRVGR